MLLMDTSEQPGPLVLHHEPMPLDAQLLVLEVGARTGRFIEAAEQNGYSPTSYFKTIDAFPDFAKGVGYATARVVERLEAAADKRAVEGWLEPVYSQKLGCKIGAIRKYSDHLLEMRLKALKPQAYRTNVAVTAQVAVGVLAVPASPPDAASWHQAFNKAAGAIDSAADE